MYQERSSPYVVFGVAEAVGIGCCFLYIQGEAQKIDKIMQVSSLVLRSPPTFSHCSTKEHISLHLYGIHHIPVCY